MWDEQYDQAEVHNVAFQRGAGIIPLMSEIAGEQHVVQPLSPQTVDPEIDAMLKAGVHFGHVKSKNHPSMQPYIFGVRNTISVIDLTKTKELLSKALEFMKGIASRGGIVLFVGTRPSARNVITEIAQKTKMPYFAQRWIGGTLTNHKVILRRVAYLESLEQERATGGFEKYTKKERMKKEEEIARLTKIFDGIRLLTRLPDAVCVVDTIEDETAVREAKRKKIPIVALVDTNANASIIDYPIPSNDDAVPAVQYMVRRIGEAIEEGQRMAAEKKGEEKTDVGDEEKKENV